MSIGSNTVFVHPNFVTLRRVGLAALVSGVAFGWLNPIAAVEGAQGAWTLGPAAVMIYVLSSVGTLLPPLLLFTAEKIVAVDTDTVRSAARTLLFLEFDVHTAAVSQVDFVMLDVSSQRPWLAIMLRGGDILVEWGRPAFGGEAALRNLGVRWAATLRSELRTVRPATESLREGEEHR